MAASTRGSDAELRFIQEKPGGASRGERLSLIRSHVARVRHRRKRDADRRAFQDCKEAEAEAEEGYEEAEICIASDNITVTKTSLVRAPLQQPLSYLDNSRW
jgi:hypothetical protein